jgi:hypothetical protein
VCTEGGSAYEATTLKAVYDIVACILKAGIAEPEETSPARQCVSLQMNYETEATQHTTEELWLYMRDERVVSHPGVHTVMGFIARKLVVFFL